MNNLSPCIYYIIFIFCQVVVEQNRETLQFASGVKVIPIHITRDYEQVWVVTNRYQKIARDTQNFAEVNYRIMAGHVEDLIADTNCDPRPMFKWDYYWNYHRSGARPAYDSRLRY